MDFLESEQNEMAKFYLESFEKNLSIEFQMLTLIEIEFFEMYK